MKASPASWRRSPPSSARRARPGAPPSESCSTCSARPRGRLSARTAANARGTAAAARPLRAQALTQYGLLVAGLAALAREEGVEAPWWSPWNEPNDPRFLAPQRAACASGAQPLAPGVYAQLARAMSAELDAAGEGGRMLLGELGGYGSGSPHRTSVAEFVAALPADVLCLGSVWSVHAYAARGRFGGGPDPVAALESALDARGGCAASAPVWVTEAGAGAPEPGAPAGAAAGEAHAACLALAAQVLRWYSDPRVRRDLPVHLPRGPGLPGRAGERRPDAPRAGLRDVARVRVLAGASAARCRARARRAARLAPMALLPASARSRVPPRVRDDVRLRALALGLGLIPPRTMHSDEDARVLLEAAAGARRAVEVGVYEGASALLLCRALGPGAELHLIDPFGRHPDALPSGWGASERATRRLLAREVRRLGAAAPRLSGTRRCRPRWPPDGRAAMSTWCSSTATTPSAAASSTGSAGARSWASAAGSCSTTRAKGGPQGRGLPGPTAVVEGYIRGGRAPGWELEREADRTVAVRRVA